MSRIIISYLFHLYKSQCSLDFMGSFINDVTRLCVFADPLFPHSHTNCLMYFV